MSKLELLELLKFLGLILFIAYFSFSMFLILMFITNMLRFEFTDNKEHSRFEYILTLVGIIIFWPFLLIKSEISKEDK